MAHATKLAVVAALTFFNQGCFRTEDEAPTSAPVARPNPKEPSIAQPSLEPTSADGFCDDFDGTSSLEWAPFLWGAEGPTASVVVDTVRARSGTHALHFTSRGGAGGAVVEPKSSPGTTLRTCTFDAYITRTGQSFSLALVEHGWSAPSNPAIAAPLQLWFQGEQVTAEPNYIVSMDSVPPSPAIGTISFSVPDPYERWIHVETSFFAGGAFASVDGTGGGFSFEASAVRQPDRIRIGIQGYTGDRDVFVDNLCCKP
jgi:hypothetical protein